MDAVHTILEALSTSTTPNTPAEFSEDQIQYARDQFMEMLRARLTDRPDSAAMLQRYLEAPQVWETQLQEALVREGVDQDGDVLDAARQVLQYAEPLDPDDVEAARPEAVEPPSTIVGILEETEDEDET